MNKKFKRKIGSLDSIFAFTEGFFAAEALDREHLFAVNFAVEELFTNMVKYNRDHGQEILLDVNRGGDELTVRLTDFDVEPFDVTKAPPADVESPLQDRKVGGLVADDRRQQGAVVQGDAGAAADHMGHGHDGVGIDEEPAACGEIGFSLCFGRGVINLWSDVVILAPGEFGRAGIRCGAVLGRRRAGLRPLIRFAAAGFRPRVHASCSR